MKILKRMLMMLAMVCFVVSMTFAQKQQDPKNDPPPKKDEVKPKLQDKEKPPPKNDGNKGNDNKGKKP